MSVSALNVVSRPVRIDRTSSGAAASTDDLVAAWKAAGREVVCVPAGHRSLNETQVDLLCRGEHDKLAEYDAERKARAEEVAARRAERG
jgi:hypothetical protein